MSPNDKEKKFRIESKTNLEQKKDNLFNNMSSYNAFMINYLNEKIL